MYTQWLILLSSGDASLSDDGCVSIPLNLISCDIEFDDELDY